LGTVAATNNREGLSMSGRPPKFDFVPKLTTYGKLDISHELIVCGVYGGRPVPHTYPKSWEEAVITVDHSKPISEERRTWPAERPSKKFIGPMPFATRPNPNPVLLMGLNEARDAFEVVYDPNDLAGQIDPMMLLNFRRKL
jgi:hypothetical protein